MTRRPDLGTDLSALLAAAPHVAEARRKVIEPRLVAREDAARKITELTEQLVGTWRDLIEQTQALSVELRQCGVENVPSAHVEFRSLSAAVATELWRLSSGPHPGSPFALPCICSGQVNRPDTLVALADLVRDANGVVRGLVA